MNRSPVQVSNWRRRRDPPTFLCGRPRGGNAFMSSRSVFFAFLCNRSKTPFRYGCMSLSKRDLCRLLCLHSRFVTPSYESLIGGIGKIRSVAPLCPACRAALAAGHHGCALTCRAPIWTACSRHIKLDGIARTVLDHSLSHHAVKRFLPDQSGLRPPPTALRGNVTPQLPLWPRYVPWHGRPRCASSTPKRCAPSCSPAPRLPASQGGVRELL